MSRNEKLRKVLRELQVDVLPDSTPHKRPLVSLVCKYLDIIAESDADVGKTISRFTRLTRQTRARSYNLYVAFHTAKCAKQLRRILRSSPTLASHGHQRRLGHRLS